jgi:copper chaperone
METIKFSVPSISCMHCVHTIQSEVADLVGVKSVKADAATKQVEVAFEAPATAEKIKSLMKEINYPVAA